MLWPQAMMRSTVLPVLALALAIGGCATGPAGKYPSLALRDAERAKGEFNPGEVKTIDVPKVDVPATGPLPERLAALVEQAQAAHRGFTQSQANATRLAAAASGSAVGSDAWASAQVALADLDSARSEAAIALGDLDTLFIAATVDSADSTAIASAREQVLALVGEEDAVLERLRAQVR